MQLEFCDECLHKENETDESFYCKLHDTRYSKDQTQCEDFEVIALYESETYECD